MTRMPRRGLTLIELMVALVLASLLTVAVLRIVTLVARDARQLRGEQADYVAAGILADRLRIDLVNARGMLADNRSLLLSGFVAPQLVSGSVRYEARAVGERTVLTRTAGGRTDLCWLDFGGFVIVPVEDVDGETPKAAVAGLPAVPGRLRVGMWDTRGRVLFSEVITHHDP